MKTIESPLDLIGKTPLIRLRKVASGIKANVLAKCEFRNPSGSIKDRIALRMINDAEKDGKLRPGYTIVEASTGNTGIALSFVGNLKGYKVQIFETIPGKIGKERVKIMENYGANVTLISREQLNEMHEDSVSGAEIELPGRIMCKELEQREQNVWWARQFSNPANVAAHNDTGQEILTQTDGNVDVFVAAIGTGGTLMGVAEVLKKKNPNTRIVGIQPASSRIPIAIGKSYPKSDTSGGIITEMLEKELIDTIVSVHDEDAVKMAHRLWKEEGIFAGISSGANVSVSVREARKLGEGKNVVTIFPDHGDRYLSEEHFVT
jgi:cysteine synthase A